MKRQELQTSLPEKHVMLSLTAARRLRRCCNEVDVRRSGSFAFRRLFEAAEGAVEGSGEVSAK